jgi:hypothetical protein
VRALATNDRDLRLVNLVKTQHVLLAHPDTSEATGLRRPALADRSTGASRGVEPLSRRVLISGCLPPDQSGAAHARRGPMLGPFLVRPTILQHDPGLAASPPVRYTLEEARSEISLPLPLFPLRIAAPASVGYQIAARPER